LNKNVIDMKRKNLIYGVLAVFLSGNTLFAQTQYDVARIIDTDLSGTARFVGMGGAMSALGGDVTTIGTNPAGIALFRSNDVSGTLSLTNTQVESNFEGIQSQENRTRMSLDQFGVVLSNPIDDANVRFVNIGMNYRKVRNFSKKMTVYGDLLGMSLTDQIARMTNNDEYGNYNPLPLDDYYQIYNELGGNYYGSAWSDVSWLGVLGIQGGLIGPEIDDNGVEYEHYIGMEGVADRYSSRETGGVNVFDINMSANVDDRVYLGLTVGFHNVDYNRSSSYTEWGRFDRMDTEYLLKNDFMTEGAGVNAKLGVIFRPFVESAFRMGLAVHTPTLYKLSDRHWASLSSSLDNYYGETDVAQFDYELLTPWKVNFSLGHTIGTSIALGAEYEYTDYSSAELRYDDGFVMDAENEWIDEDLRGVHTFRVGAEVKLIPEFSLRAGYNCSTASFKKGAYKWLYPNSTRTDAEYENMLDRNAFTLGMGFRTGQLYVDAAYQYTCQNSEFYPFDSMYSFEDAGVAYPSVDGFLPAASVKNERSQAIVTVGYRF
jgi:long-subunit fatty acid transport protein